MLGNQNISHVRERATLQVREAAEGLTQYSSCDLGNEHGPWAAHGDVPGLEILQQPHKILTDFSR